MNKYQENTERLLKEIVGAYKATQSSPLEGNNQIKHLRHQIARLARVCMEMNTRIVELETRLDLMLGSLSIDSDKKEEAEDKITAVGDVW